VVTAGAPPRRLTRRAALKELFWPRSGERLLPAVSALLLAASFPPFHPLILPFVGLVPFALFVQGLPPDREGRRAAVRGSLVFGVLFFGIVFYWILVALIWFTPLAILAYFGSLVLLTGAATLFGWMLHRSVHDARVPLWIALAVTWTATEWFRAHWPGPLAFPWGGLGTSLTGFPRLVGAAELVGERGISLWLAAANGLVATLVLRWRDVIRARRLGVGLAVLIIVPAMWGVWRARTLPLREAGRIAVVQPNIPEHVKLDPLAGLDSTLAALERLMPKIPSGSVRLVVLPEVTLSLYPRHEYARAAVDLLQSYARDTGAPVLFGALGYAGDLPSDYVPFNSAFLVEEGGLTGYQYDKRYLVPIVERVPLLPIEWLQGLPYFGKFGVGQGWPQIEVGDTSYGVLICYESTYAEGARRHRLAGADVLLNITNDSWYGREPWYTRTTALWQHPAHMVMRAIENRVGVARSANTGISLFIDPVGRVSNATRLFTEDVRSEEVLTTDVVTFYTRYGDLAGNASAIAASLFLLAAWRARRQGSSLDPNRVPV
jgi:apolipoprotein N-acyltransferase